MLLLCMGLTAANISPEVEFDGNGYINDVEREKAPDMKEPEVKKKKVVKKKKPIKKSVTSSVQAQSFQADQYRTLPITRGILSSHGDLYSNAAT